MAYQRRKRKGATLWWLALALVALLSLGTFALLGCSDGKQAAQQKDQASNGASDGAYPAIDMGSMDFDYSKRDRDASYDAGNATKINLAGTSVQVEGPGAQACDAGVTISSAGTYLLTGKLDNGQVIIEATSADKVQVVLDGASIHNETGPALYVKQADKCFVTLAPNSENALSDGSSYDLADGEDEPNATLFSKDDLTINGSGTLAITGSYQHAVNSKDDLVITGGNFAVSATEDALRGRDCVKVLDGNFVLKSGKDAIKSNKDTDANHGYVCIDGGTFAIDAGDDAVHAETVLLVNGGTVEIASCVEGYEAEQIYVNGGETSIVSSDDALNASARGSSSGNAPGPQGPGGMGANASESCLLQVNGGSIVIDAGGDGVDSNGSIEITGGTLFVSGPTSNYDGALDYELSATISGGTVLMTGSAGMAESFSDATQPFVFAQALGQAGQEVSITDASGKVLVSFVPGKPFQTVLASVAGLEDGTDYTLLIDGQATQVTATTQAQRGMGMGGRPDTGMKGKFPEGAPSEGGAPDGGFPGKPGERPGRG